MVKHLSKTVPALLLMIIMAAFFLTGCESSESSLVFSSHRNGNLDIYSIILKKPDGKKSSMRI